MNNHEYDDIIDLPHHVSARDAFPAHAVDMVAQYIAIHVQRPFNDDALAGVAPASAVRLQISQ